VAPWQFKSRSLPRGFSAHAARDAATRIPYAPEYRVRESLEECALPIWRLMLLPGDLTLRQVHHVMQLIFGWNDSHLHAFEAGPVDIGIPDDEERFCIDDRLVRLEAVAKRATDFIYVYDFGDDWLVKLAIEDRRETQRVGATPARLRCLEGERAGPPDDSGGAAGYEQLLEALAEPGHPQRESFVTWLPRGFDPACFDARTVDAQLAMLEELWSRRSKTKTAKRSNAGDLRSPT
jgi:hypothetical protein